jgi:hypothetical protein
MDYNKIKIKGDKGTKGTKNKNKKGIYSGKHVRIQVENQSKTNKVSSILSKESSKPSKKK